MLVGMLNKLPESMLEVDTHTTFKSNLDKCMDRKWLRGIRAKCGEMGFK